MSIAIFCKTLLKGGTEKQALLLSKLLKDRGIDVLLINWCIEKIDTEYLQYIKSNSLKYFGLRGNLLKKFIHFLEIVKDEKIIFILSYLTTPNLMSGISKIFKRKIVRIGGIRNEKLPFYKFFFEKMIHNNMVNATVFNNYSAREKFIKKGFKSDKIFVIHNTIIPSHINGKSKTSRSEIRIVTVSRFVKQKDFQTALSSVSKLIMRNNDKNIIYYLIGYGPLEHKIKMISANLKITERVKIIINPSNVSDILADCDIYLSTSLFEGLSNSIMEAMVACLPIVATDVGDNKYLVKDGFNGFLVQCKDTDMIADKLELLTKSEEIRRDYGNKSRILIEKEFSHNKYLENYLNLLSEFGHN